MGSAEDANLGAYSPGIRGGAVEAYGEAGGGGKIFIDFCRCVHGIDDGIEVAVVIEVGECHSVGDIEGIEAPLMIYGLEAEVSEVSKGLIRGSQGWVHEVGATRLGDGHGTEGLDLEAGVDIIHIPNKAIGDHQVFPSVEIDIEEEGAPGPIGGCYMGEVGDFGIGSVAAGELEGIAADLATIIEHADGLLVLDALAFLRQPEGMVGAEHIHGQEVVETVPVDIGDIGSHGEVAGFSDGERIDFAELAGAVIQVESIGGKSIVAYIEVGGTVLVDIAETDGEALVHGGFVIRPALGIEESAIGPGLEFEATGTIIEVEIIGFSQLEHGIANDFDTFGIASAHDVFTIAAGDIEGAAASEDGGGAVIADIEVEISVAVGVGEGNGGASVSGFEAGGLALIFEFAVALINEQGIGSPHGGDDEVESAVAIDVFEDGAGTQSIGAGDTGLGGHILKPHTAEVAIELIGFVQRTEVDIAPPVAVVIAESDSRAIGQVHIDHGVGFGEDVGESDAGEFGRDEGKAVGAPARNVERLEAIDSLLAGFPAKGTTHPYDHEEQGRWPS